MIFPGIPNQLLMDISEMDKFLVIIDQVDNRIVWMKEWQDWPRMIPTAHNLHSYKVSGPLLIGYEALYDEFKLALDSSFAKTVIASLPLSNEISNLELMRNKCTASWNFLSHLYQLQRSTWGHLPNIPIGVGDKNEEIFSIEEERKVSLMIGNDINEYHPKIWAANDMAELRNVSREIVAKFRRSPAYI